MGGNIIKILTDTGSDLSVYEGREYGIDVIPLNVIDQTGKEYILNVDMTTEDFYSSMDQGSVYTTSQINLETYIKYFEKYIKDGQEVVYISLSSGLSGTIERAKQARTILEYKYPTCKIHIIDSLSATAGQKVMAIKAKKLADQGKGPEDIRTLVKKMQENQIILFSVADLDYLYRGGRLSKSSSLVGGVLGIIPILKQNSSKGSLETVNIARGKNNFKKKFKEELDKSLADNLDIEQDIYILSPKWNERAESFKGFLAQGYGFKDENFKYSRISGVIGAHTGHKVIGLLMYKDPSPFKTLEN